MSTGAEALRQRIAEVADNDSRPDQRLLVNTVGFMFQMQHETGRYDVSAMGQVDRYGHVSVSPSIPWHADLAHLRARYDERREEMNEALLDAGLAEWRNVGSGDSELYATQELLRRLAPALAALPRDWQRWP